MGQPVKVPVSNPYSDGPNICSKYIIPNPGSMVHRSIKTAMHFAD